jgi:hypothetical protein
VPIRNVSARTVRIDDIRTGCDCQPAAPEPFELQPGESRVWSVALTELNRPEHLGRTHPLRVELRPVIEGKMTAGWTVSGARLPPIETNLSAVLFGESNRANQPPVLRTVTVTLPSRGELGAKLVPEVATVSVHPTETPNRWRVVVSPRTERPPGAFRAALTLTHTRDGATVATLDLPVEGSLARSEK